VIDSQTVHAADTVLTVSSGYEGGKKIKGRKRHVAVDTGGLLLAVVVTTASLQDRDGAFRITAALREAFSTITLVWADAGYTGRFVRDARKIWDLAVAIAERPDQAKGFVLLHRRWVVERSFAWLTSSAASYATTRPSQPPTEARIWTAATWQLSNRLTR
jgi:transposase